MRGEGKPFARRQRTSCGNVSGIPVGGAAVVTLDADNAVRGASTLRQALADHDRVGDSRRRSKERRGSHREQATSSANSWGKQLKVDRLVRPQRGITRISEASIVRESRGRVRMPSTEAAEARAGRPARGCKIGSRGLRSCGCPRGQVDQEGATPRREVRSHHRAVGHRNWRIARSERAPCSICACGPIR